MGRQHGFTLIEIIAAVVLMGFIAVFGGLFLASGVRGSINAQQTQENSIKAQIALSRIALELRDANGGPGAGSAPIVQAAAIQYTSSAAAFPGTRTLRYNAGSGTITIAPATGGAAYTLVDGVSSCSMGFTGTGAQYNVAITVSFTLQNTATPFSVTVKPRNVIPTPVTS